MSLDLFTPPPEPRRIVAGPQDWQEVRIPRIGYAYRWKLLPGTPDTGDEAPEGFILQFQDAAGDWQDVRFWRRRRDVWRHVRRLRLVEVAP